MRHTLKDRKILLQHWILSVGKVRKLNLLFILKTGWLPTPFSLFHLPDPVLSLHYCLYLIFHSLYVTPPLRAGMGNCCTISSALRWLSQV